MSAQAQAYADTLRRYCDDLIALAEGLTPEQWAQISPEEGWSLGTLVHHVALAMTTQIRWVHKISSGQQVSLPMSAINEYNAKHATQVYDQSETIDLLRANSAQLCDTIAPLTAEQLAASAPFAPSELAAITTEQLIRAVIIRHAQTHLASLRVTLDATPSPSQEP
jgi:hypothetical protein